MKKGSHHSKETKDLISKLKLGKKHTDEAKKKMSVARTGEKNAMYGRRGELSPLYGKTNATKGTHHSEETKRKMSESHKGHGCSDETKALMSKANKGRKRPDILGDKHPTKRPEIRQKLSDIVKEHWKDPVIRAKRSGENGPMYGRPTPHGKASYYTCKNGTKIQLRASYEPRVATCLDKLNITWKYELKAFPLEINDRKTTYRPDFYLPEYNIWLESKGYWRDRSYLKVKEFCVLYPDEILKVLYLKDIKQLETSIEKGEMIDFNTIGIDAKTLE